MQLLLIVCLTGVAMAAPQFFQGNFQPSGPVAQILQDERTGNPDGSFNYAFQTDNGIFVQAQGVPGSLGQTNIQGSYSFPFPEGLTGELRYVADENGFRAESPLLPTPHPLPAHAIEQIRIAEQQRASGITFE
ncbi:cuticle protein AM1199-like [Macrobrachium rosenbergii]|uniref:cuticle protein AM1199-like n=1 Tax=Macrobrachium rosenbergii TaxID=79674 RepID=UPI0034D657C0